MSDHYNKEASMEMPDKDDITTQPPPINPGEAVQEIIEKLPDDHKLFIRTKEGSEFVGDLYTNDLKALVAQLSALSQDAVKIQRNFDISLGERDAAIAERDAYKAALTPSTETKGAYTASFHVLLPDIDENGEEHVRQVNVPWTVIKEIMAAIKVEAIYKLKLKEKI